MENAIIIAVLLVILFFSIRYIVKKKAKGARCIGCPYADSCNRHCSCSTTSENKEDKTK